MLLWVLIGIWGAFEICERQNIGSQERTPSNVVAQCKFDNISDMNFVEVEWAIPQKPNGLIEFYNVSA